MIGEGFGIIPTSGELTAPEDGEVTMLFETNHAIGLKTRMVLKILFHIGIDTVQLEGKYFTRLSVRGYVKKGQTMLQFDLEAIKQAGYDPTVICVVTNKENFIINQLNKQKICLKARGLSISPFVS